jgi:NitT/TauT family transport system substrate-binding protein
MLRPVGYRRITSRASRKILATGAVCTTMTVLLAACGSDSGGGSGSDSGGGSSSGSLGNIIIATADYGVNFATVGIAVNAGCFKQAGFSKVTIELTGNTSETVSALNGGHVDIVSAVPTTIVQAVSAGSNNLVMLGSTYWGLETYLVYGKKLLSKVSPSASVADKIKALKGASVAITNPGGGDAEFIEAALATQGMSKSDITEVSSGTDANEYAALASGRVDAMVQTEPLASEAEVKGVGEIMVKPTQLAIPQIKQVVLVANKENVKSDRAKYVGVMKAMLCAGQIIVNSPTRASSLARKYGEDAPVSNSVWNSSWSLLANAGGPIYEAAKGGFGLTNMDLKNDIQASDVKNVTASEIYDSSILADAKN